MVDALGLTIFLVGIALVVIELAQPGYFIGVGGTTGVIVGLIQMLWPDFLYSWWSPIVAFGVAVVSLGVSIEFYRRFAPAVKAPETLSSDALLGQRGKVVTAVEPDNIHGKVKVGGIVWSATSQAPIDVGREVIVRRVDGVKLIVEPAPPPPTRAPAATLPDTQPSKET